jgi:hypothetical protein
VTYESQLARVGEIGAGLRTRPKAVRAAARVLVALPLLALLLFVIVMTVVVIGGLITS